MLLLQSLQNMTVSQRNVGRGMWLGKTCVIKIYKEPQVPPQKTLDSLYDFKHCASTSILITNTNQRSKELLTKLPDCHFAKSKQNHPTALYIAVTTLNYGTEPIHMETLEEESQLKTYRKRFPDFNTSSTFKLICHSLVENRADEELSWFSGSCKNPYFMGDHLKLQYTSNLSW